MCTLCLITCVFACTDLSESGSQFFSILTVQDVIIWSNRLGEYERCLFVCVGWKVLSTVITESTLITA